MCRYAVDGKLPFPSTAFFIFQPFLRQRHQNIGLAICIPGSRGYITGETNFDDRAQAAMTHSLDDILESFEFLDDWEDRYKYLIDLGRELPPLSDDEKTEVNKVRGCVSQVWLVSDVSEGSDNVPVLTYRGDSDALIVQGLVAIVLATYSGKSAREILETDIEAIFAKIGLQEHLTPQRSNGLKSMVGRIRTDANAVLKAA